MSRTVNLITATACILLISRSANAYIDPGSGSYLLQILFAGLLGGVFATKSMIGNLKSAVSRKLHPAKNDDITNAR
ncbi:MAG: hypothetical protein P4L46_15825 [Fimbriimonas sp.]|nr:hypothetical protein [Fimbriimonas sp.]